MQKHYVVKVQRAMCWFYIGQVVSTQDVVKWYTPAAIELLISDGFLKIVSEIVPPKTLVQRYIAGVDPYHAKIGDVDVVMVIDKKYL